jgi:hypothetical protein
MKPETNMRSRNGNPRRKAGKVLLPHRWVDEWIEHDTVPEVVVAWQSKMGWPTLRQRRKRYDGVVLPAEIPKGKKHCQLVAIAARRNISTHHQGFVARPSPLLVQRHGKGTQGVVVMTDGFGQMTSTKMKVG